MATSPNRRRIEIDSDVYDMLERHARWLHIPVSHTATMLIREGLDRNPRGSILKPLVDAAAERHETAEQLATDDR